MWAQQFHQNYPVLMGDGQVQNKLFTGYGSTIGLPFNIVVKTDTMEVKGMLVRSSGSMVKDVMTLCNM